MIVNNLEPPYPAIAHEAFCWRVDNEKKKSQEKWLNDT